MEWALCIIALVTIMNSSYGQCPDGCQCSKLRRDAKCKKGSCQPELPVGFDRSTVDLGITGYNLTRLDYNTFGNLFSLTDLSLDDNNVLFVSPDAFQRLPNLTLLSLRDNCFVHLQPTTFVSNKKLMILDISENSRLKLPSQGEFLNSTSLQGLILDNCYNLSPYSGSKTLNFDVFQSLPNLTELSLKNNGLQSLEISDTSKLLNLTTIYLTNNSLKTIPHHLFRSISSVENLYLDYNDIEYLPLGVFDPLEKLNKLFLQNNVLQQISPNSFLTLHNLETLDLRNNKLENITNGEFRGLDNLRVLSLSGNRLMRLSYESVKLLKSLEIIDVSNTSLSVDQLSQLAMLDNPVEVIASESKLVCDCKFYRSWSRSVHKITVSCEEVTEVTNRTYAQFECERGLDGYTVTSCIVIGAVILVFVAGVVIYVIRRRKCWRSSSHQPVVVEYHKVSQHQEQVERIHADASYDHMYARVVKDKKQGSIK